ncbi:MAG: hypothetical protein WBS22_19700 [Methylocystis sp.]
MSLLVRWVASASLAIAVFVPLSTDQAKARIRCYADAYGRRYCVRYERAPAPPEPPVYYYPAPAPESEAPRGLHSVPPTGFR